MKNLRIFLALSVLITLTNGYKILFLDPLNGKSHWLYMSSFVKALIDRGHEVTFLTSNSLKHLNLANYTEVLIDPPFNMETTSKRVIFSLKNSIVVKAKQKWSFSNGVLI